MEGVSASNSFDFYPANRYNMVRKKTSRPKSMRPLRAAYARERELYEIRRGTGGQDRLDGAHRQAGQHHRLYAGGAPFARAQARLYLGIQRRYRDRPPRLHHARGARTARHRRGEGGLFRPGAGDTHADLPPVRGQQVFGAADIGGAPPLQRPRQEREHPRPAAALPRAERHPHHQLQRRRVAV